MHQASGVSRERNPRQNANIFSVLTFFFAFGIFRKSTKKQLQEDDIYEVLHNTQAAELGDVMEKAWKEEFAKPKPSLTRALLRVFGKEYLVYGVTYFLVNSCVMTLKPLATGKLVAYFAPASKQTLSEVCMWGSLVVISAVVMSSFFQYYFFCLEHLALRVKIALCSLIYRKSLKLSDVTLSQVSNGKIVTMISRDVNVFEGALLYGHDVWTGFVLLVVMTVVMYRQIQVAAVIGISFLLFLTPVQVWMGVFTKRLRLKTSARTDERLRRIQEILTSIKLIKFYTWEKYFTIITNKLRFLEMHKLKKIYYLKAAIIGTGAFSYRLSFFACIFAYSLFDNTLTAEKAFVVVSCYRYLHYMISYAVPMSVSHLAEARSSVKRIKAFLIVPELTPVAKEEHAVISAKVSVKDLEVKFLEKPVLHGVSLDMAAPMLIGVTGPVGGGKSTLLKAILKDVPASGGSVTTFGEISYASQEPWMFPATVRQNILFGKPYNPSRYQAVLDVCALKQDIETFPQKDQTIVGDKGLNFSKGQQARINLARAIYKDCDIYLLDDVFSSLDAKVGKHVFDSCVKKFLKGKLTILICHNTAFLQETDRVVLIERGHIVDQGTFDELKDKRLNLDGHANINTGLEVKEKEYFSDEKAKMIYEEDSGGKAEGIYEENKEEGKVSMGVYKKYFEYAGGWKSALLVVLLGMGAESLSVYFDYYLTVWLKVEEKIGELKNNITLNPLNSTLVNMYEDESILRHKTMVIYNVLIVACASAVIFEFTLFRVGVRASTYLHNNVFKTVVGATMQFFDKHLSGNILNRFSKDFSIIDDQMPYAFFHAMSCSFLVVFMGVTIVQTSAWLLIPLSILFGILFSTQKLYLMASRRLKRLEGATRAPVVGYLNSSLEGLTTIRAEGNQRILTDQFDKHQDLNSSAMYMYLSVQRTFGFWLHMLCNIFSAVIIVLFIFMQDRLATFSGNVGLALTQSFRMALLLQWAIRQMAEIENSMTSVERVLEYTGAEQENFSGTQPHHWPTLGKIEYKNVYLKYPTSDKYQLYDVNFVIKPRQKVGIVGRTGAGKSSVISALFRLYDIDGAIFIDGVNIRDVELETVRTKISIIPQDPVLFEGTVRNNLDPNGELTDAQLWHALLEVKLKGTIENLPDGLNSTVDYGGGNFSVGQRQLFCLARAILRNNKILVLDEATANIDPQTDALIQETVRRVFADCTILTIAHKLNTVIDSDKIIVLDNGEVIENDDPQSLLRRKTGVFYNLAKQSGLVDASD